MENCESGKEGLHVDRVLSLFVLRVVRMHVCTEHKVM